MVSTPETTSLLLTTTADMTTLFTSQPDGHTASNPPYQGLGREQEREECVLIDYV